MSSSIVQSQLSSLMASAGSSKRTPEVKKPVRKGKSSQPASEKSKADKSLQITSESIEFSTLL
jgi:hypothetical protein